MSSIIQQAAIDYNDDISRVLNFAQQKALDHITKCRTAALGGVMTVCSKCGDTHIHFRSCGDRCCPVCQGEKGAIWAEKQMENALPINYYHMVFTLPDSLNSFFLANTKLLGKILFDASSQAIMKLSSDPKYLGARPGYTSVYHSWGQTIQYHPHLHVIITAGGIDDNGNFVLPKHDNFLFPVKVLALVFRGIFIKLFMKAIPGELNLKDELYQKAFLPYLKEPINDPSYIVKYLSRYTHRAAITDNRIVAYDKVAGTITFKYKDNRNHGITKEMTLSVVEFFRRLLMHVLPKGFMKIRHYGILGNYKKRIRINNCRQQLEKLGHKIKFSGVVSLKHRTCKLCGGELNKAILLSSSFMRAHPMLC